MLSSEPRKVKNCFFCQGAGKRKDAGKNKKCSICNGTGQVVIWENDCRDWPTISSGIPKLEEYNF